MNIEVHTMSKLASGNFNALVQIITITRCATGAGCLNVTSIKQFTYFAHNFSIALAVKRAKLKMQSSNATLQRLNAQMIN